MEPHAHHRQGGSFVTGMSLGRNTSGSSRFAPASTQSSHLKDYPGAADPNGTLTHRKSFSLRDRGYTTATLDTNPTPTVESNATLVAGQFSDAESDEDPSLPEAKRQRVDEQAEIYQGNSQSHRHVSVTNVSTAKETSRCLSPAILRQPSVISTNTDGATQAITRGEAMQVPKKTTPDDSSLLPSAVRRLAALVGIPESSQAIIHSTLPLPLKRAASQAPGFQHSSPTTAGVKRHSSLTLNLPRPSSTMPEHYFRALSGVQTGFVSTQSGSEPSQHALRPSSGRQPVDSNTASPTETLVGRSGFVEKIDTQISVPPRIFHQVLDSCTSSSAVSPALLSSIAHLSPALFDLPPRGSTASVTESPLTSNADIDPIFAAPRFTQSSSDPAGYTMPARGTFSIPAPSSLEELEALHSDPTPIDGTLKYDQLAPAQSSCASTTTGELNRLDEDTPVTAQKENLKSSHGAQKQDENLPLLEVSHSTRKRKPRPSKKKTDASGDQPDSGEPQVELVKPPPTINGKISHGRKVPAGYVKRTPNSFIMFRSHVIANKLLPPGVENDNRQISRVVSGLWAGLSEDDLRTWQTASRELRAAARAKNPDLKHPPNQKRKEIIRRKRSGQLPGETPEQRVEREKARAAALAKVIIDARGERLDKDKLVELAGISLPESSDCTTPGERDASREASRPEFRAPASIPGDSIGSTSMSECAESTLSTSPRPSPSTMFSSRLDAVIEEPMGLTDTNPTSTRNGIVKKTSRSRRPPSTSKKSTESDKSTSKRRPAKKVTESDPLDGQVVNPSHENKSQPSSEAQAQPTHSVNQPNFMDLAAFSSIFESGPDQTGYPAPSNTYSHDMFQSLEISTSHQTMPPVTAPVTSDGSKTMVIDPTILAAPSDQTVTSTPCEPISGFWNNPILQDPSGDFQTQYTATGTDPMAILTDIASGSSTDRQNCFPTFEMLSQFVASNHMDLSQFINQQFPTSQSTESNSYPEFDFGSLYSSADASQPSNLNLAFGDPDASGGNGLFSTPSETQQATVDQGLASVGSANLENWTWPQF